METIFILLGMVTLYSWIHFTVVQHTKTYKQRTSYEKTVTWFAIVTLALTVLGMMI